MTLAREERLKTLGLWPVWRLRESGVTEEPVPEPEAVITEERGYVSIVAKRPSASVIAPVAKDDSEVSGLDWEALRSNVLNCTRCPLHESRTQGVFGAGDIQADWLIIGEAPGADEDKQGEPFVGQAGKLLEAMLAATGLQRDRNVYIANVLKSRPPSNRDPKPEEVAACIPYLERQIDLIQPKMILALGRFAAQSLLLTDASISRLRGRVHEYRGVPLIVTYHPAYLLRNPADKGKVWDDICLARNTLESGRAGRNKGD
jgi:DNA polymerase